MKDATKRSIVRSIQIVFAIPILGDIYIPFDKLPGYAGPTRYVFFPLMVVSERRCRATTYFEEIGLEDAAANRWPAAQGAACSSL